MQHISMNNIEAEVGYHLPEFLNTLFVGRNLRLEVGNIMANIPGRIRCGSKEFFSFFFH